MPEFWLSISFFIFISLILGTVFYCLKKEADTLKAIEEEIRKEMAVHRPSYTKPTLVKTDENQ